MSMNSRNHSQGFTLLELMLAIGIIALIAVVAVPNFRPVLKDARLEQSVQFLQADLMKARQMAKGNEEHKRTRVVYIPHGRYRIELETGEGSGSFEPVATKRLATGCSFDSLTAEEAVVFNNNGSADGRLSISINNESARISVNHVTGRIEVEYP